MKNLAVSEARKVDKLSITVTCDEPAVSGSGLERGAEGDGREVLAEAEALRSEAAEAFLKGTSKTTTINNPIIIPLSFIYL